MSDEKRDDDIVAFLLNGHLLVREVGSMREFQVITRGHMRMMAACDLGPRWKEFAEAPAVAKFKPGIPTNTLAMVKR